MQQTIEGTANDLRLTMDAPRQDSHSRYAVLDGWRGISILFVLATHMLPLGPHGWGNSFLGVVGMSLFFTLSGFLITSTLLERPDIPSFLIRRGCRILPLAVLYATVALLLQGSEPAYYLPHYLFVTNYDGPHTTRLTSHFWSLCVEVHFYIFVALLVLFGGRRPLLLLPLVGVIITAFRVAHGAYVSVETHSRVDEILAGASLALVHAGRLAPGVKGLLTRAPQVLLAALLVLSSYPDLPAMNYLRPYCAAALVGSTLWRPANGLSRTLSCAPLRYIATISYALYVVHKVTMFGWLGTGLWPVRYLVKRPISFVVTFALAHLSTFHYERWWIDLGKRLTTGGTRRFPEAESATVASATTTL